MATAGGLFEGFGLTEEASSILPPTYLDLYEKWSMACGNYHTLQSQRLDSRQMKPKDCTLDFPARKPTYDLAPATILTFRLSLPTRRFNIFLPALLNVVVIASISISMGNGGNGGV